MIFISPTKNQIELANIKAQQMGILNNSIKNGEGNMYGFLGEILVSDLIGGTISNTYEYDIIKNNITIDVKTKTCTSKPKEYYFCSVAAFNISQDCDAYIFVRIMENFSSAWVLGGCPKQYFYNTATFNKEGEIDKSSTFGWTFKADCYNLRIDQLFKLKIL